jgi:hypothetical protein
MSRHPILSDHSRWVRVVGTALMIGVFFAATFMAGVVVGYRHGVYDGWKVGIPDVDTATPPSVAIP